MIRSLACCFLLACGSATPAIKTSAPAGTIGGSAWTMELESLSYALTHARAAKPRRRGRTAP